MQAVRFYGVGWYHHPALWGTRDGLVPFREFWGWWRAIQATRAWERLELVRAIGITQADESSRRRAITEDQGIAFGG